jgi:ribonucleoside-diphosphate reductase alpha chain
MLTAVNCSERGRDYVAFVTQHAEVRVSRADTASPFIDTVAVEAWDAWFRWRDHGTLRDETLEATWERVAAALAAAEPANAPAWQRRFVEAFASWSVLPDERVLASAGAGRATWGVSTPLAAVVNAAVFVRAPLSPRAVIDTPALERCAELAVRMLDDAAVVGAGTSGGVPRRLGIGLIGLADALAMLGVSYGEPAAHQQARALVRALAEGCLRGSVAVACERGADPDAAAIQVPRAVARGLPPSLVADAARRGLRHRTLTAIVPHPRLALLANNVSDAIDPLLGMRRCAIDAPEGTRLIESRGFVQTLRRRRSASSTPAATPECPVRLDVIEQLDMRAALQPWIDDPISYPLLTLREPTPQMLLDWGWHATARGMLLSHWRRIDSLPP